MIELAEVVGLDRLPGGRLDPMGASTFGLGLVITDAIAPRGDRDRARPGRQRLHRRRRGHGRRPWAPAARRDRTEPPWRWALADLASIDLAPLRATLGATRFVVATDVDTPLLGPNGAAAVFGAAEGRDARREVAILERRLTDLGRGRSREPPGGTVARPRRGRGRRDRVRRRRPARRRPFAPGIEVVLELVGFADRLAGADLVITGEGSLDQQSLAGKAPVGVARAAAAYGVPVVAVAGRRPLERR